MHVMTSEPDPKKPWQIKNKIWFQPICLYEFQNKMIKQIGCPTNSQQSCPSQAL